MPDHKTIIKQLITQMGRSLINAAFTIITRANPVNVIIKIKRLETGSTLNNKPASILIKNIAPAVLNTRIMADTGAKIATTIATKEIKNRYITPAMAAFILLISLLKPYIQSNNNPMATYIVGESYLVAVISRYLAPQASPAVATKPKAVMSHMLFNILASC